MSRFIVRLIRSPVVLFGVSAILVFTVFATLFQMVHKSVGPHSDSAVSVIDMLRNKKQVFTKVDTMSQNTAEDQPPHKDSLKSITGAGAQLTIEVGEPINLPGGAEHSILSLSDAQFRKMPVSEMMSWYGQADGGGTCAKDFGNDLITRWRETKEAYCPARAKRSGPQDAEESAQLHSYIDCYLVHQTRHHGNGDNLCHMHNVAVDLRLFADDSQTRNVIRTYVDTRHAKQPYIKFPKGFIEGDCTPNPELWSAVNMPGWNADLTVGAYQEQHGPRDDICAEWVTHKVLINQRDTFANFFHDSEDFFNAFVAMAVLEWKPSDTQMFLTDLYPRGPFWEIWSKVFSQGNEDVTKEGAMTAMTAWDLRQKYQHLPPGKKVCFKDLAIGIYGPAAPVTVASWDTPCTKTALVRAYSDYVIRGLQLQGHTHYAREAPSDTIVVTYMARRPSKEWPEKKYCDSKNSFFLCELWAGFGERRLGRMVSNDAAVVEALKGLQGQQIGNAKKIVVQDVDYNVLSFEEQIRTDLNTDIMIGPHGAGLMHNIFMRDRAALIELFVDGSSVNRHFHNLAFWFGHEYQGVTVSNPIRIPELLSIVKSTIEAIDVTKY